MNSDLLQGFHLKDQLVEPVKGQISGRAGSVHLPPKAMEVLLCLASNSGQLVTRELLLEEVWGTGHGSPEALNHAVSEIRHALNDHLENPEYLQTLPRRGYRLIIDPEPVTQNTSTGVFGSTMAVEAGLFENLKRRGVLETALAYLVFGWLLIQIADIVFGQLHMPTWVGTFVTVLVIAGFPIALILSWYLEFRDGRAIVDTKSPKDAIRRRFSRTYMSVIGALAIAAVLVSVVDRFIGLPEPGIQVVESSGENTFLPPVLENSIAVLPFLNVDGSDETQIFANGLVDDVITRLSRVPGLRVSSRGDAYTLDPNTESRRVRDRLRVAMYVEGSVQFAGDTMRIIVQLIDSESGTHILARTFDRPREDFFDVRDEITELTVANVRVALPSDTQLFLAGDYEKSDLSAYILFRRGKEVYEQPRTLDSIAEIIGYYEQALKIDPQYAAAHAGLCDAYVARYGLSNADKDIKSAENACASALASNPQLHMVHTALGELYRRTGRPGAAEDAYDQALSINQKDAQAMIGLSKVYMQQQKYPDAEQLLHTAIANQPGNWRSINGLGEFLFISGRYVEAADEFRRVVLLDRDNFAARTNLGSALTMAGDFEAGKLVYEESIAIKESRTAYSNLGVIYYYLGEFEKSVATHRRAVELSPEEAVKWLNLADALYFSQQREEAMTAFRRAADLAESRVAVDATDFDTIFVLSWAQEMLGASEKASASIARGREVAPMDPYGLYYEALIDVRTGDYQSALTTLRLAVDNGYPANMLAAEPYLNELQADPEFQALITRTQ